MNTNENNISETTRPFGYWIKAVDRLMAAEFASAFETEGVTRRDWRLLNIIDGTVASGRPLHPRKLRRLIELGWIREEGAGWTLTDDGTAAKQRLGTIVDGIRARVAGAVEPDEFEAMTTALQKIARELGWEEGARLPRPRRRGHGRRGFGKRGFGPRGFGPRGHRAGFPGRPAQHIHIHLND